MVTHHLSLFTDGSTNRNLSDLFNEIEGWVTWLDSSLAFDALAEVANDDGVFLNLPLNDPMAPIPQSIRTMHELVYKVEVLYVLCLLLGGKHRQKVSKGFRKRSKDADNRMYFFVSDQEHIKMY